MDCPKCNCKFTLVETDRTHPEDEDINLDFYLNLKPTLTKTGTIKFLDILRKYASKEEILFVLEKWISYCNNALDKNIEMLEEHRNALKQKELRETKISFNILKDKLELNLNIEIPESILYNIREDIYDAIDKLETN